MILVFKNISDEIKELVLECQENFDLEYNHEHINLNQVVNVHNDILTIEGHRCALWSDSFAPLMHALKLKNYKPTKYVTSDKRLKWHETLSSFLETRASPAQLLIEVEKSPESRSIYWPARMLAKEAEKYLPGSIEYRKAFTEGSLPPPEAYIIRKILLDIYETI